MRKGVLAPLNDELAILASKISLENKLPMADSIIMAAALHHKAIIWTQDDDFKNFKNVKYFKK